MSIFNKYEATIGLEIHAQLLTNTKNIPLMKIFMGET